jgi:foldase protein PrsA
MSIVRMRKGIRRKIEVSVGKRRLSIGSPMEILFWVIIVIFVVGAFYTFGGPGSGAGGGRQQAARKVAKIVATVDGQTITRTDFDKLYMPRVSDMPSNEMVVSDRYLKTSILDSAVQRILFLGAAKKEGITVSNADVTAKADEVIKEQMDQRFPNRKALAKFLQRKQKTADQYKAEIKAELLKDRTALREQVLFDRLQEAVKGRVQVSDDDLRANYDKVKARHILIMPSKLEQDDKAKAEATKQAPPQKKDYKALAKQKADELLARARKGEDFAKLATEFSQDPGSAAKGGLLGSSRPPAPGQKQDPADKDYFGRGEMVPEFDKAAFSLKPGQISDVIETNYGFHIIQVLDRKTILPADFDKKKEDYRKQLLETKKTEAWDEYQKTLKKDAKIEVADPELAAYRNLDDNKKDEAMPLLATAVQNDPQNVGAKYQLAMLVKESGDKDQAIKLFRELTENERASSVPQVHMELADLYLAKKMSKEAIEEYKAASEWASAYDYQGMFAHQQIQAKFKELKQDDLAKAEQVWLDECNKQMQESGGMGGLGGMGGGMPITIPSG